MARLMPSVIVVCACLAAGVAAQEPLAAQDLARDQVLELARAGDDAAALEACRRYTDAHPLDAVMHYNQACLEARRGLRDEAVTSLERAASLGYDDGNAWAEDPDLAPLAGDPRFNALLTEIRTRLVLAAAERGLTLAADAPRDLPLFTAVPSPVSSLPLATLAWRPDALEIRLPEPAFLGTLPPGSSRLIVTLGLPDAAEPYLTRNAFVFAFGVDAKGAGWGALWVPTLDRWQPVAELAPRRVASGLPLAVAIPWSLVQPLHPLTDPVLGINVTLDGRGPSAGPWAVFAAANDPQVFDPAAAARRVVRLDFAVEDVPGPAFLGRLEDSIVHGGVLAFELVAVAPTAGRGALSVDFVDNQGRSLLAGGAEAGGLDLAAGLQRLSRQASFAGLRTGSYQLRATLDLPDGESADWSATVLNLAPGWSDSLAARTQNLAALDRRTAAHFLAAVRSAVRDHLPRRNPGAIATTLGDLDVMLKRAEATGSILPTGGSGLIVYPGADGGDRLCTVYRPQPGAERGSETPVLVIDDAPGGETLLAGRFDRFYTHGDLGGAGARHPLYLVPHLPAAGRAAEARAALEFVRQRFATDAILVAGVDGGGATALRLAADGRGGLAALMVLAGGNLDPWPGATDTELSAGLALLPRALPVDWTDFNRETGTGGAPGVLRALAATGVDLNTQTAGGSLSLSRAADRIVLWAEELPLPGAE